MQLVSWYQIVCLLCSSMSEYTEIFYRENEKCNWQNLRIEMKAKSTRLGKCQIIHVSVSVKGSSQMTDGGICIKQWPR